MHTRRLVLAGVVTIGLLVTSAVGALADEDDQAVEADGVSEEVLFELTLARDDLPRELHGIEVERWKMAPGVELAIDAVSTVSGGRAIVVEGGVLEVVPVVDSVVWQAASSSPDIATAGEVARLGAGDSIYLPIVRPPAAAGAVQLTISNPETGDATALSFDLNYIGKDILVPPEGHDLDAMSYTKIPAESMPVGAALFRLARISLEPDASLVPPPPPAFALYHVEDGLIEYLDERPGGAYGDEWYAGDSGISGEREDPNETLTAIDGQPASLLELAIIPAD